MGKKNKKRRRSEAATACSTSGKTPKVQVQNPLFNKQNEFLSRLSELERKEFFSPKLPSERRAELWMKQADLGEDLVNRYAWATPNETAIRILREFSPLVEIGCGSNAYWCSLLRKSGVDIIGFDTNINEGGIIQTQTQKKKKEKSQSDNNAVPKYLKQGGPEVLGSKDLKHSRRTLFLCYPDEADLEDNEAEGIEGAPVSMGWQCLDIYEGEYIIHVGEIFLDSNYSLEQAPWGRSSSPEFQQRLASEFHCLLKVALPNWLHTRDSISVWKRSQVNTIVFAADEDEDDEDEEVEYRHIPLDERLPENLAAPCLEHLLPTTATVNAKKKSLKSSPQENKYPLTKTTKEQQKKPMKKEPDTPWEDLDLITSDEHGKYRTPW